MERVGKIVEEQGEALTEDTPTVKLTDLAGQRIFYGLQHFLMTEALTLYMAAVSLAHTLDEGLKDSDEVYGMTHGENLEFWLNLIHARAPGAPIIVVCTKMDLVDDETCRQRFAVIRASFDGKPYKNQIVQILCVSSKTGAGLDAVTKAVYSQLRPYNTFLAAFASTSSTIWTAASAAFGRLTGQSQPPAMKISDRSGLKRYGEEVSIGWFKFLSIFRELVAEGEKLMSLKDAREIGRSCCNITDDDELMSMLHELHDLGVLFLEDVPDAYKCPMTGRPMVDPVSTSDGHTFERSAIIDHLRSSSTSPLTGAVLMEKKVVPNVNLRKVIEEWCGERHADFSDSDQRTIVLDLEWTFVHMFKPLQLCREEAEKGTGDMAVSELQNAGLLHRSLLPLMWPDLEPNTRSSALKYMITFGLCWPVSDDQWVFLSLFPPKPPEAQSP